MNIEPNVLVVFAAAIITALCTGLGALPFLFIENVNRRWLGIGNALAAGLMFGASIGLVAEGVRYDVSRVAVGIGLGLILIVVAHSIIKDRDEEFQIGAVDGADAVKMLLIIGVMTAHSFAEGIGVGISYGDTGAFGALISVAIAVHNIPEGLAISLVLIPRGVSVWRSAGWGVFSSLPQPLMAVPAFLFVLNFHPFLPVGLGLAAGAMFYMVFTELLSEALEEISRVTVGAAAVLAMVAMLAFQAIIG
jgi:zinc transporter ZupT